MKSLRYRFTEFLFRHMVRPMMEKAAENPEAFLEKQYRTQQKKKLPLRTLHKKYEFDEKAVNGISYYAVHSRKKTAKKLVIYFPGGGFIMPGDAGDFEFAQEMADQTGAEVWIVWYPLFPKATEEGILESVSEVYREALQKCDAQNIAFFGLSSGGSLCLDICTYIKDRELRLPLPGKLIPVSATIQMPPTEVQFAEMKRIGIKDAMFPPEYVTASVKMMKLCGSDHFLGNSIAYSWKGFPRILALYGSQEIYCAQLNAFQEKCAVDGIDLRTYVGEGMMHTWVAAGWLPEAKEAREIIYAYIRK